MNIQQIETAISALPEQDFWKLASWLEEKFSSKWDNQIAADFKSGKLDSLIADAMAEHKLGNTKKI
jgi:hypothetical protein